MLSWWPVFVDFASWVACTTFTRAGNGADVQIARCERGRLAVVQIARDGQRLEEDFGHDHRAAEVEDDAPLVESGERCREPAESAVARVPNRRAAGGGVLVYDLGAQRSVNGARDSQSIGGQQHGQIGIGELGTLQRPRDASPIPNRFLPS